MKLYAHTALSMAAAILLLGGCGSDSTQTPAIDNNKIVYNTLQQPQNASTSVTMLQGLALETSAVDSAQIVAPTVEEDVLHINDGEMIHLIANSEMMGVDGNISSYSWTDMDGNVLSETDTLDRVLHYDPRFDRDDNGTTKYIKTLTIITEDGKHFTQSYTIFVHKEALPTGQAVLGPLAQAHFSLQKLHSKSIIAEGVTSQGDGSDVTTAGLVNINYPILNSLEEGYYLLTVAGGKDVDRDDDLVWDAKPTINKGVIHAIITADDLRNGNYKVNIFTEAVYQYLYKVGDLDRLSDSELSQQMNGLSSELLAVDLNQDGQKDYEDLLVWNPATDKDKLTIDYATEVEPYVEEILAGVYAGGDTPTGEKYVVSKKIIGNVTTIYEYDAKGSMLSETIMDTQSGEVIEKKTYLNSYDNEGRLVSQKLLDPKIETRWIYDEQGNITEKQVGLYDTGTEFRPYERYLYENGVIVSGEVNKGEVPIIYAYETNEYGNIVKEIMTWGDQTFVTEYSYEYDANGNVIKRYKDGILEYEQEWEKI